MNNKTPRFWSFLTLFLVAFAANAQDVPPEPGSAYQITLLTVIYIFGIILLFIAGALWRISTHLRRYMQKEFKGKEVVAKRSWWERTFQFKSVSTDKDTMINHPHDGIYELDNPPPPWFMFLFYITIVVAVVYYIRFTFTDSGQTQIEEYQKEMQDAEGVQETRLESSGVKIDETTVEYLVDEESLSTGKAIYDGNCKICHGDYGQGAIGPNFTDDYYMHGGSIQDIFKVIKYGVVEKGMISWESQLGPESIQKVASYIKSLQGTTSPLPGKEAQGELYVEEAVTTPAETTETEDVPSQ